MDSESSSNLNVGVVILSSDHCIIGINKYASEILDFDPSYIGKSVYHCHHPKNHAKIRHLLKKACDSTHEVPQHLFMKVSERILAVNFCRMDLKNMPLKYFFVKTFVDITEQLGATIDQKSKIIEIRKLPVYNGGAFLFIDISSIFLMKCEGNYCSIFTDSGEYFLRITMSEIEKKYISAKLLRVHRTFIVNPEKIHRIKQNAKGQFFIDFNKKNLPLVPVARRRKSSLKNSLRLNKCKLSIPFNKPFIV